MIADVTVSLPTGIEPFFLGYGVLGVMFLLVLLGWIVPKWVVEEYRKREAIKDGLIQELTDSVRRLADAAEIQMAKRPPTRTRTRG